MSIEKSGTVRWRIEARDGQPFTVQTEGPATALLRGLIQVGAAGLPEPGADDPETSATLAALEALGIPLLRRWGRVHLAAAVCRHPMQSGAAHALVS